MNFHEISKTTSWFFWAISTEWTPTSFLPKKVTSRCARMLSWTMKSHWALCTHPCRSMAYVIFIILWKFQNTLLVKNPIESLAEQRGVMMNYQAKECTTAWKYRAFGLLDHSKMCHHLNSLYWGYEIFLIGNPLQWVSRHPYFRVI